MVRVPITGIDGISSISSSQDEKKSNDQIMQKISKRQIYTLEMPNKAIISGSRANLFGHKPPYSPQK